MIGRGDLIAYGLVVLAWGGSWHVIIHQFGPVPVETSLAYRFLLGAVLLAPVLLVAQKGRLALSARDHLWIALQGMLVFGLGYWIFYRAVGAMTSGLVAVVFSLLTIFNACNQSLFFGLPLERRVLAAALIGIVGVGLIFAPELWAVNINFGILEGVAWTLLATWLASLGNMISLRNSRAGIPATVFTAYGMGYGGALMLLVCVLEYGAPTFEMTASYILSLFYLGAFASSLAFALYFGLIARIGADRAAYVSVLMPLVALIISALFEDFRLGPEVGAGVALILLGNVMALTRGRQAAAAARIEKT